MSLHIKAPKGAIAKKILLPGDPLRAKYIADNFLDNAVCYNEVRGELGFTGTYKGVRISVQATGMGVASSSIYVNELIEIYGCKQLIRIGSCGAICEDINLMDIILGTGASTDSAINRNRFNGCDYAPLADFSLIRKAADIADENGWKFQAGNIFTSDLFYHDDPSYWRKWADFGCLAIEMEAAGIYTLAAKYKVQALTILTVSDHIIKEEYLDADQRQTGFTQMMKLALETLINS